MRVNGTVSLNKVMELNFGQMELNTRENGKIITLMAMGSSSILMVMFMRGSGVMGRLTGEGSITGCLVQHMMGIG